MISELGQDVFHGARLLHRSPGFSALVIMTLALGIGANTAVFSLINTVLLQPLPYSAPDRLVRVWAKNQKQDTRLAISPAEFFDLQNRSQVFEAVGALFPSGGGNLTNVAEPERLNGARASASIFSVLGVDTILGHTFAPQDDRPGSERTIIISHDLWQRRFSEDPNIVGRNIVLSGFSYAIRGVLPKGFATPGILPITRDIWLPLGSDPTLSRPNTRYLRLYGKLKPGVDLRRAQSEMNGLAQQWAAAYPDTNTDIGIELVPLHEEMSGQVRPALLMLAGAAGFLLLIACANVANLMLSRTVERQRELAVRVAVGAGQARLIRQILGEVLLLALMGGGLGFLIAYWTNDAMVSLVTGMLPRAGEIVVDQRVFLFSMGVSLIAALLSGLVPALRAQSLNLTQTMKEAVVQNRSAHGPGGWLVALELGLSLLLLIGAGLLMESFLHLRQVHLGFNPDGVLNARISLPASRYPEGRGILSFNQQLLESIEQLPGVQSAAVVDWMPFGDGGGATNTFALDNTEGSAEFRVVSPHYFQTLQIPLRKGRAFQSSDTTESPPVFIVTEAAVRKYWQGADPLGTRITVREDPQVTGQIVGIVGDVKHYTLYEEPAPLIYASHTQAPWMTRETRELLVRADRNPLALSDGIRREIRALEKDVPITGFQAMTQIVSVPLVQPKFYTLLVGLFAGLALLLASVGIYGVVSYWVRQRSREIAIRVALGGNRSHAVRLMLWDSGPLIVVGVVGGLVAALVLTRFLSRLPFFHVSPTDPLVFIGVSIFLVALALSACYIPARNAARIDPMRVLRQD